METSKSEMRAEHGDTAKISRKGASELNYAEIRAGVTGARLGELIEQGRLNRTDLTLIIPQRTLNRRMGKNQMLRLEEADAVARVMRVRDHAKRALEEPDLVEQWLSSPNPELDGERPLEMARTDLGAREVEAVLTRFAHGVVG